MTAEIEVRIGGVAVNSLAAIGSPELTWQRPNPGSGGTGGCWLAEFELGMVAGRNPSWLREGALVEVLLHGDPIWAGTVDSDDRGEPRKVSAFGIGRAADKFYATDASYAPTTDALEAVEHAISLGLPWRGVAPFTVPGQGIGNPLPSDALPGVDLSTPLRLPALLDAAALANGKVWRVDGDRLLRFEDAPTVPRWITSPDAPPMGSGDSEFATQLVGVYRTDPVDESAVAYAYWPMAPANDVQASTWGIRQELVDYRPRGVMLPGDVVLDLQMRLRAAGPRSAWTTALEVSSQTLRTMGQVPTSLATVRDNQMMRIARVADGSGNILVGQVADVVIGEVRWRPAEDVATIAPVGFTDRSLSGVLAVAAATADRLDEMEG